MVFKIRVERDMANGRREVTELNAKDQAHANRLTRTMKIEQRTRPQYDGSSQTTKVTEKR